MADSSIDQILAETNISGLDIPDALSRMGNSGKLYVRIIHSFVTNMPGNLEELATSGINAETLPDYAIKIHGAKGSCYGIGANVVGDLAKELEMAAKASNLEFCQQTNDSFIAQTEELLKELAALEDRIENSESAGRAEVAKPDAGKLAELLSATQNFDIDRMGSLVEEITSKSYTQDADVISKIKAAFESFDYQQVEELIKAYI